MVGIICTRILCTRVFTSQKKILQCNMKKHENIVSLSSLIKGIEKRRINGDNLLEHKSDT